MHCDELNYDVWTSEVMAMVDGGLELEDGEIDDLGGWRDRWECTLSTEASNNVFSRLEPRNGDSFSEKLQDSQGINSRDFVFQSSVPPSGPWEQQGTSFSSLSRSRFRRGRETPAIARGRERAVFVEMNGKWWVGARAHLGKDSASVDVSFNLSFKSEYLPKKKEK